MKLGLPSAGKLRQNIRHRSNIVDVNDATDEVQPAASGEPAVAMPLMEVNLGFNSELYSYFDEIQASGVYGNFGPQVSTFEAEIASRLGYSEDQVVSASNATLGLLGAQKVMKIPSWVIQSWTFSATAHAAEAANSAESMFFADVDINTWSLTPAAVPPGSGAVITPPFGSAVTVGRDWNHVGAMVIDAAASIGSVPTIEKDFSRPWAIVFSFHATKVLGIGEGAIIVFSDAEVADRFRMWTNFGFSGSREAQFFATNAKMSEVSGAIGRFRLANWRSERDEWARARSLVHKVGIELSINPFFSRSDWISPYWIAFFDSEHEKAQAEIELRSAGVPTRDWWGKGCHAMPAFSRVARAAGFQVTEELAGRTMGLPFFRGISSEQVEEVGSIIRRVLR